MNDVYLFFLLILQIFATFCHVLQRTDKVVSSLVEAAVPFEQLLSSLFISYLLVTLKHAVIFNGHNN